MGTGDITNYLSPLLGVHVGIGLANETVSGEPVSGGGSSEEITRGVVYGSTSVGVGYCMDHCSRRDRLGLSIDRQNLGVAGFVTGLWSPSPSNGSVIAGGKITGGSMMSNIAILGGKNFDSDNLVVGGELTIGFLPPAHVQVFIDPEETSQWIFLLGGGLGF